MIALGRVLRRVLDALYFAGGVIAALCLIAILVLIILQMLARWTGEVFPGAPDYAGYCMAAASFFAFAYALNHGAHIRVSIVLNALDAGRRWLETWCFAIGGAAATYLAYYAVKNTHLSWKLNDISQGQDATPMWIPQLPMAAGAILLAICFWDHLVQLLFKGTHGIQASTVDEGPAAE